GGIGEGGGGEGGGRVGKGGVGEEFSELNLLRGKPGVSCEKGQALQVFLAAGGIHGESAAVVASGTGGNDRDSEQSGFDPDRSANRYGIVRDFKQRISADVHGGMDQGQVIRQLSERALDQLQLPGFLRVVTLLGFDHVRRV